MSRQPLVVPSEMIASARALEVHVFAHTPTFRSRGISHDLARWEALADDVAYFWGFAEDYVNELGCRDRLEIWLSNADGDLFEWLEEAVGALDDRFRSNTREKELEVPLPPTSAEYWWLRRDPNDEEISAQIHARWQG